MQMHNLCLCPLHLVGAAAPGAVEERGVVVRGLGAAVMGGVVAHGDVEQLHAAALNTQSCNRPSDTILNEYI